VSKRRARHPPVGRRHIGNIDYGRVRCGLIAPSEMTRLIQS
jgi:hypothetical protein